MVVVLQFPFEFLDTFHLSLSGSDKFLDFLIQFFIRVGHLKLGSPYLFCGAVSFPTCTTSTILFWYERHYFNSLLKQIRTNARLSQHIQGFLYTLFLIIISTLVEDIPQVKDNPIKSPL